MAHPLDSAGLFSQLIFSWTGPLFAKKGEIDENDMYPVRQHDSSAEMSRTLHATWDAEVERHRRGEKASIGRAFIRAFGRSYAVNATPIVVKAVFVLAQTQLLAFLLDELRSQGPDFDQTAAYLYALGLIITGAAGAMLHHHYFFHAWKAGMHWRAAATSLIFEKSLVLRLGSLGSVSAGHIVNLASTDIERFQKGCQFFVYIFLAPVEAAFIFWLLWREIGVATLAGLAVLAFFVAIQSYFSRAFGRLRSSTARITDERVKLTGQVINGARVVKLMGYEPPFAQLVAAVRKREIAQVFKSSWLRGSNEGIFTVAPIIIGAASYLTYYATGGVLTPRRVFTTVALFQFLQGESASMGRTHIAISMGRTHIAVTLGTGRIPFNTCLCSHKVAPRRFCRSNLFCSGDHQIPSHGHRVAGGAPHLPGASAEVPAATGDSQRPA